MYGGPCGTPGTLPVGGDVARVAHGDADVVRRVAEAVRDLKGGGLLPFQSVGVDGVDEGDLLALGDETGELEGAVEGAVDAEDVGAVGDGLGHLPLGDVALGHEDQGGKTAAGAVGGGGGAGVAGGGAEDGACAELLGVGNGHDHATILEGARGVAPLKLEEEPADAQLLLDLGRPDQGCVAFTQRDEGGSVRYRKEVPVLVEDTLAHLPAPCLGGFTHGGS